MIVSSAHTTLGELFDRARSTVVGDSVTIPLEGRPDKYPFDWFAFAGYVDLVFAPGVVVPRAMKQEGEDPDAAVLPVRFEVRTTPAVGNVTFGRQNFKRLSPFLGWRGPGLRFALQRDSATRRFVMVILIVPVLYALLFAILLSRSRHEGASGLRDLLLGLLGGTVALLPVRQVLVPPDVQGLTIVDWWLGSTILLFVAASLWAFPAAVGLGVAGPSRVAVVAARHRVGLSIAGKAAVAGLLLFAAVHVPIALASDPGHMPASPGGRAALILIAAGCLAGALRASRSAMQSHRSSDAVGIGTLAEKLGHAKLVGLICAGIVVALVLFLAGWFLVLHIGWALGGSSPYGSG